jgi:hypothetical protein
MLADKTLVVNADGNLEARVKPPREPGPAVETIGL